MPERDRNERRYCDDEIRALILTQAATPIGASKVLIKDRLYSYADREAVGVLIGHMVRAGELISASYTRGSGAGKPSIRAFVNKHHAEAFAAGQGVGTRAVVKPSAAAKVASQAPTFPRLHDMLDPLGSSRGPALTLLRKPGSNARRIEPMDKPPRVEGVITASTRVTVVPTCADQRYTVSELPKGYVSKLSPGDARPWAQAAAGSRAA
jgi:hypothetical protein